MAADLRPELLALLRLGAAGRDGVGTALGLLVEELGMELAFVSGFAGGRRVVTHAARASSDVPLPVGLDDPVDGTLCHLVASGQLPALVPDAAADPRIGPDAHIRQWPLRAFAGVPLVRDGEVVGALCCASASPLGSLRPSDVATLRTVAHHVAAVLASPEAPAPGAPEPDLGDVAAVVAGAADLEALTRPLLELLARVTGLESTYLTAVDWQRDRQQVLLAHDAGAMHVPEGLVVEWGDTLCRRSLESGRRWVPDVPATWGDSDAARDLGVVTYVSVPVKDESDDVVGTLCAASTTSTEVAPGHLATMELFASLIGGQMARERQRQREGERLRRLERRTRELSRLAERDPLTGLLNRAGVVAWLEAVRADLRGGQLAVAFVDVDGFKEVNDRWGHATGDTALVALGTALVASGRPGDLYGRIGGDEFVVASVLPPGGSALAAWTSRLRAAASVAVGGTAVAATVGVTGTTDPTTSVEDLLAAADAAMYHRKRTCAQR